MEKVAAAAIGYGSYYVPAAWLAKFSGFLHRGMRGSRPGTRIEGDADTFQLLTVFATGKHQLSFGGLRPTGCGGQLRLGSTTCTTASCSGVRVARPHYIDQGCNVAQADHGKGWSFAKQVFMTEAPRRVSTSTNIAVRSCA